MGVPNYVSSSLHLRVALSPQQFLSLPFKTPRRLGCRASCVVTLWASIWFVVSTPFFNIRTLPLCVESLEDAGSFTISQRMRTERHAR